MIGLILETIHFKYICENSDVKIDDVLTEWDMIKSNMYGRQAEAGQHKYEPYIIKYIFFVFIYELDLLI